MPSAEIITIGTEILLGDILDTNAPYLARCLRNLGIDLYRKTSIGDNAHRIAEAIQHSLDRADIVITTGGLGPTVDDPTRDAVALAVGVSTEYREELWEQIQDRFRRFGRPPTENNRRQAYIPHGAIAVENQVGTAPSFIVEAGMKSIISLPGVPSEMEYLVQNAVIPYLQQRYVLTGIIKTRVLHTAGVGESQIDDLIDDLERLSNPTVGLAAHSGQVDVRITAKGASEAEADAHIKPVEADLRKRLGKWIYGADSDTLESVALQHLEEKGWGLAVVEAGSGGELTRRLAVLSSSGFQGGQVLPGRPDPGELMGLTQAFRELRGSEVGLGVAVYPTTERYEVSFALISPEGVQQYTRPYGGPPAYAPRWTVNNGLNAVRSL
jgi:competence/damage-inducible protein CinA-like protein